MPAAAAILRLGWAAGWVVSDTVPPAGPLTLSR